MKIAPLKMNDPWLRRIRDSGEAHIETLSGVTIENVVEMELVELQHGGPETNFRPYLHLRGELVSARPDGELPYGIDEVVLRRGAGVHIDAFYDFNGRQLSDLVAKGYFTQGFDVPESLSGIPWELPGEADFVIVAPESADQPPVVFMELHHQADMELDEANSGYDLSEYFPHHDPEQALDADKSVEDASRSMDRDGSGVDIFADVDFDVAKPRKKTTLEERVSEIDLEQVGDHEVMTNSIFERLLAEIKTRNGVDGPLSLAESEPESPEAEDDLYSSRVAPNVERVVNQAVTSAESVSVAPENAPAADDTGASTDAAPVDDGFIDFNESVADVESESESPGAEPEAEPELESEPEEEDGTEVDETTAAESTGSASDRDAAKAAESRRVRRDAQARAARAAAEESEAQADADDLSI